MGKTVYTVTQPSSQHAFNNQAYVGTENETAPQGESQEFPPASEIPKYKDIPSEGGDTLKLLFLLTVICASFVVGVVVTGYNV